MAFIQTGHRASLFGLSLRADSNRDAGLTFWHHRGRSEAVDLNTKRFAYHCPHLPSQRELRVKYSLSFRLRDLIPPPPPPKRATERSPRTSGGGTRRTAGEEVSVEGRGVPLEPEGPLLRGLPRGVHTPGRPRRGGWSEGGVKKPDRGTRATPPLTPGYISGSSWGTRELYRTIGGARLKAIRVNLEMVAMGRRGRGPAVFAPHGGRGPVAAWAGRPPQEPLLQAAPVPLPTELRLGGGARGPQMGLQRGQQARTQTEHFHYLGRP